MPYDVIYPPTLALKPNRLEFRKVAIEWAPYVDWPIQVNHAKLNGSCTLITGEDIKFIRGALSIVVAKGFNFDGASVPRLFWNLSGFAPMGKHLWAALLHDWLCEHPDIASRMEADAIFFDLLLETNVGWRGWVMGLAVWGYGMAKTLKQRRVVCPTPGDS